MNPATPSWMLDFQVRQQGKPQNIYYDPAHASSHDFLYKPVRLRRQYTARNNYYDCISYRVSSIDIRIILIGF